MKKTSLAIAIAALTTTAAPLTHAVDYSVWGEIYVELTDAESATDLNLDVTTADFGFEITEEFGDVDVSGHLDFSGGDYDTAGISVSGAYGSVYVGDDGVGVVPGFADNLENNSGNNFTDDAGDVIDYSLPLSGPVSANVFVGITTGNDEDLDFIGAYGSYSIAGATVALGYTTAEAADDSILDLGVSYETGPIYVALDYQDVDSAADATIAVSGTYTTGAVSVTPYYEEQGDFDVAALNISYSFTDNFYTFFETAAYSDESSDNSEIGLVLNF